MLQRIIVLFINIPFIGTIVSYAPSVLQTAAGVPVLPILRGIFSVSAVAGLLVFFKPLLAGIGRALLLLVKPRLSKEERIARRNLRDARMVQRMIDDAQCPNEAAELRALAAHR